MRLHTLAVQLRPVAAAILAVLSVTTTTTTTQHPPVVPLTAATATVPRQPAPIRHLRMSIRPPSRIHPTYIVRPLSNMELLPPVHLRPICTSTAVIAKERAFITVRDKRCRRFPSRRIVS
uniref:Putative secreted protein n=1 Tax=Anopheles darlingi TaxID=43151 RepID=A0A2M4DEF3_ANODA